MQTHLPCHGSTDVDILAAARAIVARSAATMLHARRRDDPRVPGQWGTPAPPHAVAIAGAMFRRTD